jgi:hypothetical protein
MEKYIYYTIAFFSLVIFFLYLYILGEKIINGYKHRKRQLYSKQIHQLLELVISELIDNGSIKIEHLDELNGYCKDSEKIEIITERMVYYFENLRGNFTVKMTELCERIGLVKHEIKSLKNKNIYRKALACKRLGEFRSRKAIKHILKELNTERTDIIYNVILALAKIGEEEAFISAFVSIDNQLLLSERSLIEVVDSFEGDKKSIYKKLISSENDFLASVAIKSAGNFGDYSLSEQISQAFNQESKERKIAAIKAIGNMGDSRYISQVVALLKDEDWEIRAVAAKSLGRFEDAAAVRPLTEALSDRQWYVRYNAANSIMAIDNEMKSMLNIFEGEDRFAKDIMISVLENTGFMNNIEVFKSSADEVKRKIAFLIYDYIEMSK